MPRRREERVEGTPVTPGKEGKKKRKREIGNPSGNGRDRAYHLLAEREHTLPVASHPPVVRMKGRKKEALATSSPRLRGRVKREDRTEQGPARTGETG